MPVVIISGDALAYSGDPRSHPPVADPAILALLHGVYSDDACARYLEDQQLQELNVEGGRLRFAYCRDTNTLRVKTAYDVSRELNDAERTQLIEETVAQWSDGIGSGSFGNHNLVVLSTSLAMALQNSGQTEIGELFVDAYPMVDDNHVRIEFKECGHSDDELIADLIDDSDAGNVRAMTALGQRYEAGDGVAQDGESAFNLYSRAAEQRDPFAITLLGLCYEVGTGCAKDSAEAKKLYENATDLDFPLAMHCLGEIYEKENPEESVALYRRGASLGDPGCLAELGECLEFGKGVEKNLDEALTCYQRCIEYGFDAVSDAIKRIEDGESR